MHAILGILVVVVALGVLVHTVQQAREAHRGVPATPRHGQGRRFRVPQGRTTARAPGHDPARPRGTGWLEHRRRIALENVKHRNAVLRDAARHKNGLVREWARHRMRMAEREAEHDRRPAADSPPPPADSPAPPPPSSPPPPPQSPRTVPSTVVPDDGTTPQPAAPTQGTPQPPAGNAPAPQLSGGTGMTHAAVEQAVDGMHRVHSRAAAGNIRSKQWAIKVCAEVFTRISSMMMMMTRALVDARYGPEITEPLLRAGVLAQAAAMACAESDAAITSLANMRVGDLADSPRSAPERSELSESGAR